MKPNENPQAAQTMRQLNFEAFCRERGQFLPEYMKFREGLFSSGRGAVAHLLGMYFCSPVVADTAENNAWFASVQDFEAELDKTNENDRTSPALKAKLNTIVQKFYSLLSKNDGYW